jgi:hypothetical protein
MDCKCIAIDRPRRPAGDILLKLYDILTKLTSRFQYSLSIRVLFVIVRWNAYIVEHINQTVKIIDIVKLFFI